MLETDSALLMHLSVSGACRMSPRSRERLRTALKGFAPSEMEPRTSDGELVTDLLAHAGAEFERKSSVGRAHAAGSSPSGSSSASVHSPFHVRPLVYSLSFAPTSTCMRTNARSTSPAACKGPVLPHVRHLVCASFTLPRPT